jgi:uncharacterized RDD family membrane protein YckC
MATVPDVAARPLSARRSGAAGSRYGGLITRTLAAALDALLINLAALAVAAVVALVLSIFPVSHEKKQLLAAIGGVLFAVWVVAYFVTFWSTTGQTPGDRVMRVAVRCEDGGRLKPLRALWRLFGAVVGLVLFLGYVPILLNRRRRALHDWMAGTVVLNQPLQREEQEDEPQLPYA